MFLQTTTEFDHDFGINLTLHERKKREKTEIKILSFINEMQSQRLVLAETPLSKQCKVGPEQSSLLPLRPLGFYGILAQISLRYDWLKAWGGLGWVRAGRVHCKMNQDFFVFA